jgi:hypothetical protein
VLAEISSKVEIHSYPGKPDGKTLEGTYGLFLKFEGVNSKIKFLIRSTSFVFFFTAILGTKHT